MIRVLVCGGRDWGDELAVELVLNHLHARFGIVAVIHGAARGADAMGMQWANRHGIHHIPYPANWQLFGLGAGRRRNRKMAKEGKADLVVAFPGGNGTADMIEVARRAGMPVLQFGGYLFQTTCENPTLDGVMLAL
jgi:predicted Rossmann-fold nucleotide-binding protein